MLTRTTVKLLGFWTLCWAFGIAMTKLYLREPSVPFLWPLAIAGVLVLVGVYRVMQFPSRGEPRELLLAFLLAKLISSAAERLIWP